MIIPQYPHYLYVLQHTQEAKQNQTTGSFETQPAVWKYWGSCREETNGRGAYIATSGGNNFIFSSLIQLPKETERINEGTQILVANRKLDNDFWQNSKCSECVKQNECSDFETELSDNEFVEKLRVEGVAVISGKCAKYDLGRLHCRLWV